MSKTSWYDKLPFVYIGLIFSILLQAFLFTPLVFATHQCGNGVCQPFGHHNESCSSCSTDCGVCNPSTPGPTQPPTVSPTTPPSVTTPPASTTSPTQPPGFTNPPGSTTPPENSGGDGSSGSGSGSNNDSTNSSGSVIFINPPTVSLISSYPAFTNQTTLTLSGSAATATGSIERVEYNLDNSGWQTANGTTSFAVSVFNLSEGSHTISVRAKNTSGVSTPENSYLKVAFVVVTTPPSILVVVPDKPTDTLEVLGQITSAAPLVVSEISLDNGKTWEVMPIRANRFRYTQTELEDGNYDIIVRVIDQAGNVGRSTPKTLILDTIPPIFGSAIFSSGPLITNTPLFITGQPITFVASFKGGPTDVQVTAGDAAAINLEAVSGSYLWKGNIVVPSVDSKNLTIRAVDGAGNKFEKTISDVTVIKAGTITNASGKPIDGATVKLYSLNPDTATWEIWDAASYNQTNPQTTKELGEYGFFVPSGKYFLEVSASGIKTSQSYIFETSKETVVSENIVLTSILDYALKLPFAKEVNIKFPWNYVPDNFSISFKDQIALSKPVSNQEAKLSLLNWDGQEVTSLPQNKNIVFLALWSPKTSEYLTSLSTHVSTQDSVIIFIQANPNEARSFMQKGGYDFPYLVDPVGETANALQIVTVPTSFRLNQDGQITYTDMENID